MTPAIELRDVRKTLGHKRVLRGVNLSLNKGETLALIGKSGGGKSVTLKHIVGLLQPDSGQVFVEGQNLAEMTANQLGELRKKFGFLFQDGALLNSLTVGENVALPLREHTDLSEDVINNMVSESLAYVGLEFHDHMMPSILSGGMKKRVGLARAIIRKPGIILYDEPTHGLDPVRTTIVNDLIIKLKKEHNVTSLFVTHDIPSCLRVADRMAFLREGVIYFSGVPSEFLESDDPAIKEFMFGIEAGSILEEED